MNDHYYTASPSSPHRETERRTCVNGREFSFITDSGVFSRDGEDPGSALLVKACGDVTGRVLDLGCGWGYVGICLLGTVKGISVCFTDINERAVELCRKNLERNRLQAEKVVSGDGAENLEGTFDHILMNPPIHAGKKVIYRLFGEARDRLNANGTLRVVIMTRQGASSAQQELERLFGNCAVVSRGSGYKVLVSAKGCGAEEGA